MHVAKIREEEIHFHRTDLFRIWKLNGLWSIIEGKKPWFEKSIFLVLYLSNFTHRREGTFMIPTLSLNRGPFRFCILCITPIVK